MKIHQKKLKEIIDLAGQADKGAVESKWKKLFPPISDDAQLSKAAIKNVLQQQQETVQQLFETYIQSLEEQLSTVLDDAQRTVLDDAQHTVLDDAQLANLQQQLQQRQQQLQDGLQRQKQILQLLSTIIKMYNEAAQAVIGKIV
jgi:hypothetical protein